MEQTLGWRHFRVQQTRKTKGTTTVFVLMQASMDAAAKIWVSGGQRTERELLLLLLLLLLHSSVL